jgi:YD repeat-containing protein
MGYDALGRRTWQSARIAMNQGAAPAQPTLPAISTAPVPGQGKLWRTYRYSAEGELAEQNDNTRGALQFQYDAAGQLLKRSAPDGHTGLEQFKTRALSTTCGAT